MCLASIAVAVARSGRSPAPRYQDRYAGQVASNSDCQRGPGVASLMKWTVTGILRADTWPAPSRPAVQPAAQSIAAQSIAAQSIVDGSIRARSMVVAAGAATWRCATVTSAAFAAAGLARTLRRSLVDLSELDRGGGEDGGLGMANVLFMLSR